MNERIRLLADKAGQLQLATPDNPSADAIMVLIGPNIEKFAELIVRECIDICRYHPSIIVSNNWSGHDVAQDIVQRFEEHFGVEE